MLEIMIEQDPRYLIDRHESAALVLILMFMEIYNRQLHLRQVFGKNLAR